MKKNFYFTGLLSILGIALYLFSSFNYLLFHMTVESITLIIGILIFTISIISKNFEQSSFVVTLGPGILVASLITFIHMAAFKGMNVIPGYDANLPTQLWIVLNYVLSLSILTAILLGNKKIKLHWNIAGFSLIGILGTLMCFAGVFPTCFVEGEGLTNFKRVSEYLIIFIYLVCMALITRKKVTLNKETHITMMLFLSLLTIAEFMFTLYSDVYGIQNFIGHYFRFVALLVVYIFVVVETVQNPFNSIFSELKTLSKQFEAILDHIPGLVFYKDKENNFIRVNKYMADAHKVTKAEMEGKNLERFYPPEDAIKYYHDDLMVIKSGESRLNIEEPWKTEQGLRWVNTSKIPFKNNKEEIVGILGLSFDITEKHTMELKLEKMTRIDFLTKVNNRRYFFELAENRLIQNKSSNSNNAAFLMMDIDHFKKINDTFGHSVGDEFLIKVAEICMKTIKSTDLMGRIGGDEFGVYLTDTDFKEALLTAERIRANINSTDMGLYDSKKVEISVSIGMTMPVSGDENLNEIMKRADKALFKAKHLGRNRVASL